MDSQMKKIVDKLTNSMSTVSENKTSPYETPAEVIRIDEEDNIAWVRIPGGTSETPVKRTINCLPGDTVQVRVSNGTAFIQGNETAPPTDDRVANIASDKADEAQLTADEAYEHALTAQESASRARNAADRAEESAAEAEEAAGNAMKGLGQVEDVVGTLNWITEHSSVTEDTTPTAGKSYYIKNQDGTFTLVTDVEGKNPAQEGWYELTEAVQNYILSHLALTNDGLYVMKDDSHWRFLIRNDGIYVVDENNIPVNQMGVMGNVVGHETNMHLKMDYDSIDFMDGEDRLGYIGNNKLLFASAEVTNNLYVTDRYVWRKTPQGAMGLYLR